MLYLPSPSFQPLRVYSDGAGTQSIAVMVLQAQGRLPRPFDYFVFSNVGDDSENPATLEYRERYVIPFAAEHGLNLVECQHLYKGEPQTLYENLTSNNRSIPIPVVFPGQGHGNRKCTEDFKIEVVNKWCKTQGVSHVETGIGFSIEEGGRIYKKYPYWHDRHWSRDRKTRQWVMTARNAKRRFGFWKKYEYPLAELRLTKADCINLVIALGWPAPPPSLCWFCPFTTRRTWIERKVNNDPLFDRSVKLQHTVNDKYQAMRSEHPKASNFVALHRDGIPLESVGLQPSLFDIYADTDESCDDGVCGY